MNGTFKVEKISTQNERDNVGKKKFRTNYVTAN